MPRPIHDPEGVDERRAAVGLEPLAVYLERVRELVRRQLGEVGPTGGEVGEG